MQSIYVCPKTRKLLNENVDGLFCGDISYPFFKGYNDVNIPNFLDTEKYGEATKKSLSMYDQKTSADIYRNFLNWLFQTFNENESSFRENLVKKLRIEKGNKILITGCGLGDEIQSILDAVGLEGEVYASDLAFEMIFAASHNVMPDKNNSDNIYFSICDAMNLPFSDDFFDGAFHFGGINLFDDVRLSIEEMERVVKPGGRVVFGDEGIAPWLRGTEYGNIAVNNNVLWAHSAPIKLLPRNSMDVNLSWILGNCFYVIDFEVSKNGPFMDIDFFHKGRRGGSMRTRYFGQLEGVSEESKKFVLEDAKRKEISVHDWLEHVIREKIKS